MTDVDHKQIAISYQPKGAPTVIVGVLIARSVTSNVTFITRHIDDMSPLTRFGFLFLDFGFCGLNFCV